MATRVPKTLIKSIDPSQIDSGGATNGQILTYSGSTNTWIASSLSAQGFNASLSSNGYQKLPSGLIMQWGEFTANATATIPSQKIILPISFSSKIFFASTSPDGTNTVGEFAVIDWVTVNTTTVSSIGVFTNYVGVCKYFAVGY